MGNSDRSSTPIIVLLLVQVILGGVILYRIINLEKIIAGSSVFYPTQEGVYVEGVVDGGDPSIGSENAPITIIEFADFQCPYCAEADNTIQEILAKYGEKVRFVYRDFPLSDLHPDAINASLAAECAKDQNEYWKMHNSLFNNQTDLSLRSIQHQANLIGLNMNQFESCMATHKFDEEIQEDILDGKKYGVRGTPTFFINGWRISGGDKVSITQLIEDQLQ